MKNYLRNFSIYAMPAVRGLERVHDLLRMTATAG